MMKGKFMADWWVGCGICNDHQPLDMHGNQNNKPKAAREIGYRHTKEYGWICPRCQPKALTPDHQPQAAG